MQNILRNIPSGGSSATPWILLMILCGYVVAGLFLFNFIGLAFVLPFFDFQPEKALEIFSDPYSSGEARLPLLIIQGVTSLGAFFLVPLFFIKRNLNLQLSPFFSRPQNLYQPVVMVVIIMFSFMTVNSLIIEWNRNIVFPDFLSWFEEYAQAKEKELEALTYYLTAFESPFQFALGFVIIAILPAIGEELLFRGLVQNLFHTAFKNIHLAIWVTAFLFGAFHLQFYGLVPRMLLGVLFGYLYFWSGHLSLAMLGHFINNGFTLILLYMSQQGVIDYDPTGEEMMPSTWAILLFLVIGSAVLILYRNYFSVKEHE